MVRQYQFGLWADDLWPPAVIKFTPFFSPACRQHIQAYVLRFPPSPLRMPNLSDPTAVDTTKVPINDLSTSVPCHARDDPERRLLRKIDLRMSILLILYTLNLVGLKFL